MAQYRLGFVGRGTVKDDFKRWMYNFRSKEDFFFKIGESNDISTKGESDYVWSLKDINFEINKVDFVGIIGKNSSTKVTYQIPGNVLNDDIYQILLYLHRIAGRLLFL